MIVSMAIICLLSIMFLPTLFLYEKQEDDNNSEIQPLVLNISEQSPVSSTLESQI